MALLPFNPACFFSFLLPLMAAFYFVHGGAELLSNCTKEFSCGNLGFVEFPFAKHTQPHCGLVAVNCDTTPPTVQLGTGGDWYQLQLVLQGAEYAINLGDPKLQKPFQSHNYSNLNYTIHFQNSPSITFLNWDACFLNPILKCNDSQADDGIGNYERYNCSDGISLFYKHQLPENNPKCDAVNCTLYPSPFIIQQTKNDGLTAQFVLRMQVSQTCQECYHGGGQCTEDSKKEFHCAQATGNTTTGNITTVIYTPTGNTSKRNPIPIIVSGVLALIVVSMAIFLVWQRKDGRKGGYSRNTSLDPTSDLERGSSRLFGILVFSYSELEEATSNFHPSKELGDGAFGTVYYGNTITDMLFKQYSPPTAPVFRIRTPSSTREKVVVKTYSDIIIQVYHGQFQQLWLEIFRRS